VTLERAESKERDLVSEVASARAHNRTLVLVVPVFNEAEAIAPFLGAIAPVFHALRERFKVEGSILFIDDGSVDRTKEIIRSAIEVRTNSAVRLISLSRNFGKEAALAAGLNEADADAVVPIDVDLQDPPEVLIPMVGRWLEGWSIVQAVRASRGCESLAKRATARAFYRFIGKISTVPIQADIGDFQLLTRQVVEQLRRYPERTRFTKGLFAAVGFPRAQVAFERSARSAGKTKFNAWKLWNFAIEGITAFSTLPLQIWTYMGTAIATMAFVAAVWIIARTLAFGVVTPGYASTLVTMLFFGGVQLIGLGIVGEYVARIAIEVRNRPLYHVAYDSGKDEHPNA
jgi:glycosyltransferase involved in cell wall biosynthesis